MTATENASNDVYRCNFSSFLARTRSNRTHAARALGNKPSSPVRPRTHPQPASLFPTGHRRPDAAIATAQASCLVDGGGHQVRPGARGGPTAPVPAPAAVPLLRGHAGRPAPPRAGIVWSAGAGAAAAATLLPGAPPAAVPGAPAPAAAHRAGAARAERGERGRERLHARPRPAHRPHPQGTPPSRGLRPPPAAPPLLRPRRRRRRLRRLEGVLLRVPVPAHPRDAPRRRPRLRRPPHRRRPRGAPHPRAGLRELPGPGEDAGGEGGAAAVRALLLPVPRRRVGGGRVRPDHGLPGDPPRRHRHRPVPAAVAAGRPDGAGDEPGAGVARADAAGVPDAVVQVDGAAVRGPGEPGQRGHAGDADRRGRPVQPAGPPLGGRAEGVRAHRRDDRRPDVAAHRPAWRAQLQLHHQRPLLLHPFQLGN